MSARLNRVPRVVPTRPGALHRLTGWWRLRQLRGRAESLACAHSEICDELSRLKAEKFRLRWHQTPTLDARIAAAASDCKRYGEELERVRLQIQRMQTA